MTHILRIRIHATASKYVRLQYLEYIKNYKDNIVDDSDLLSNEIKKHIENPDLPDNLYKHCYNELITEKPDTISLEEFENMIKNYITNILQNKQALHRQLIIEIRFHQKQLKQ
jgi:hypothetical protein